MESLIAGKRKLNFTFVYVNEGFLHILPIINGAVYPPVFYENITPATRIFKDRDLDTCYVYSVPPKELGVDVEEATYLDKKRIEAFERSLRQTKPRKKD